MSSSTTSVFACVALLAGIMPPAFAERQLSASAPPRAMKAAPREALSAGLSPSATIELGPLADTQVNAARMKRDTGRGAIPVGVVRDVPTNAGALSSGLKWIAVSGGHAAQWRVRATGAKGLRIALDLKRTVPGLRVRFASARDADASGEAIVRTGTAWSPLIEGDDARVELFVPDGASPDDVDAALAHVAHHFVDAKSQWLAASCEVDLVCEARSDPVLARAGSASIKLNWIEGYTAFACSGTLLNPADGSFRPYVYTAAHCIHDQAAADSLVTLWFYEKASCGGEDARPAVQVAGGAELLVSDEGADASLLRLNRMPPAEAVYSGWDSSTPSVGEPLVALHHANGEVTKVSHGTVVAPPPWPAFAVAWTSGIVQGGSSGSGAFTRIASPHADLLMRGGLSSANASCATPGFGYYSRLDKVWPAIAPYLSIAPEHANATGLWSDAADPGWGLTLNQQGDILFAVLFTYADDGRASWLVASDLRKDSSGAFSGALYRASRSTVASVGQMRVALTSANAAKVEYEVNGRAVSTVVTREAFNGAPPVCIATQASRAGASSMQDLWWSPEDPGWGIGIAHQGDILFATLFTYDEAGRAAWLVGSDVARQADGSFAGTLYRTSAARADGLSKGVKASAAGAVRLSFAGGERGTASITIDGRTVEKRIERQVFGPSQPVCR